MPVRVLDHRGRPTNVTFRVMQPVLVMESRAHNTMGLPGYGSSHSLQQLRVSVFSVIPQGTCMPSRSTVR